MTDPAPKIVCIGQAVVDIVMTVETMPRRAEKYRAQDAAIVGGGCAANAAVAVARLGGRAIWGGRLGQDEIGDLILRGLEAEQVDCALAKRLETGRSSFSTILIDSAGERQIVNFRDPDLAEDADWLGQALPQDAAAILADTRWGPGAAVAMTAAQRLGVPGVMDAEAPVSVAMAALELASHVIFSAQGLTDLTGEEDLPAGLKQARDRLPGFVAVTDGQAGVYWLEEDGLANEPGFPVDVVDTLGAGDVWHGAFALALGEGRDLRLALRFANAAASLKCSRPGGRDGTPDRAAVNSFLAAR